MVLRKTDKNIVAGWNFWLVYIIIYILMWFVLEMSKKGRRYKLKFVREY